MRGFQKFRGGRQLQCREILGGHALPVDVGVLRIAIGRILRKRETHTQILLFSEGAEDVGIAHSAIVAPLARGVVVGLATDELDVAAIALKRSARNEIDDATDGVAITVGCHCLYDLDVGDAVGHQERRISSAARASCVRNPVSVNLH